MQRSQRAYDNLALKFAVDLADDLDKPVLVYFGLFDRYPMGSVRAFQFLLGGLQETAAHLVEHGIGFLMRRECPADGVVRVAKECRACCVVVDEDYLRTGRQWRSSAAQRLGVKLVQIDGDTVVPARISDHEEWGAYTLRPKILRVLDEHLKTVPDSWPKRKWTAQLSDGVDLPAVSPSELAASLDVDLQVAPVPGMHGGFAAATARVDSFIANRLPLYGSKRNDIGVDASSGLSPYLHFGQISPLRVAQAVGESDAPDDCVDGFLEQLIVRRELAVNYCVYNDRYDSLDAAADWALRTLREHESDPREEVYTLQELESGLTHDDLWNAAQTELVKSGRIHPYMRMVWAKNIMGWSESPDEALARAIYLNDKYALDGRDPNGYANIAWCIFGKHDRPFAPRHVFGKIRYMSSSATKRKTNWRAYLERVRGL
jgi:deoxyribodipyrimidine photo-lyase